MFQPARLNRAMVASCKLPLGMPSRILLATEFLFLFGFGFLPKCNGAREAAHCAFMADEPVAFNFNAKQKRVVVAIGRCRNDAQPIAARFTLHPQFLSGAAPEGDEARFKSLCVA